MESGYHFRAMLEEEGLLEKPQQAIEEIRLRAARIFLERDLAAEPLNLAFVKVMNDIARHLRVPSVAEGVDDPATAEILRKAGVRYAQGVYFNGLFFAYLVAPRACHRFVGYLEEEAVLTYTRIIKEIEAGNLPEWEKMEAPEIAIQYWKMPEGKRTMLDLMLYVRADEAKHREVNHTLGNLNQREDPNPYTAIFRNSDKPRPSKGADLMKPTGWEREEVI